MPRPQNSYSRLLAIVAATAVTVVGVAAVALAAGGATTSAKRVRVKCPKRVVRGKKTVTCRVKGRALRGPKGPRGSRGRRGLKGERGKIGRRGLPGRPGVSGYAIASQIFAGVEVVNSGAQRGLSAVQTVDCPGGKRVIGGGADLGTGASQNSEQRQVTISLSGPDGSGTGWSVQLFNNSTTLDTSIDLRVYAICANTG